MPSYRVLGGALQSELDFPELPPAAPDQAGRWTLSVGAGAPPRGGGEPLGADAVRDVGEVTLARTAVGYRLAYPDTGVYDITHGGSRITWYPPAERRYPPDRFAEAVRIDVLGRVLAVAMHAAGTEALHSSAVLPNDRGTIAFVAPKFHGKSTLASALVARGARLVTDDTLPVLAGARPRAAPGVHSVRVHRDSAHQLAAALPGLAMGPWGKLQSSRLPPERLVTDATPLAAIYVLAPQRATAGAPATITRQQLVATVAAVSLVAHAKLGPLLGKTSAPGLLAWGVRLASAVPVYRLVFPRDFTRLPDVVDQLLAWHGAVTPT